MDSKRDRGVRGLQKAVRGCKRGSLSKPHPNERKVEYQR